MLVDENGKQMGNFSLEEALKIAQARNLDLVEVAPHANPVVCKLLDYNKYKYQQKKRQQSHKSQSVKEIRFHLFIEEHDYRVKLQNIRRFLERGDKVYLRLIFRRRELSQAKVGERLFERISEDTADIAKVEQKLKHIGSQFVMVLSPK